MDDGILEFQRGDIKRVIANPSAKEKFGDFYWLNFDPVCLQLFNYQGYRLGPGHNWK